MCSARFISSRPDKFDTDNPFGDRRCTDLFYTGNSGKADFGSTSKIQTGVFGVGKVWECEFSAETRITNDIRYP